MGKFEHTEATHTFTHVDDIQETPEFTSLREEVDNVTGALKQEVIGGQGLPSKSEKMSSTEPPVPTTTTDNNGENKNPIQVITPESIPEGIGGLFQKTRLNIAQDNMQEEIIAIQESGSFGKFRNLLMNENIADLSANQSVTQQQSQLLANKKALLASLERTNSLLASSIQEPEHEIIQQAIIQQVQNDSWYQTKIQQIVAQGAQDEKSEAEIQQQIIAYNEEVTTNLLPVFVMEMNAGTITMTKGGKSFTLSEETKQVVEENEEFKLLDTLYKKFIQNPYLDITNQNYLEWPETTNQTPLEHDLIAAVDKNPSLEAFLFDDPEESQQNFHTKTKDNLHTGYSSDMFSRLELCLGKENTKQEEQTESAYHQLIEELLTGINAFTHKRCNQFVALQYCKQLTACFSATKSSGKSTLTDMGIDFTALTIGAETLDFQQPITYQGLRTNVSIDGSTGSLQLPDGRATLFGHATSLRTINTQTTSPLQINEKLNESVQLTCDEIQTCSSVEEIQNLITKKAQIEADKASTSQDQKEIATLLEQETLLAHLHHFFTGSSSDSLLTPLSFQDEQHAKACEATCTRRIEGEGNWGPLSLEQLRTMNKALSNPALKHLFAPCTKNKSTGIETFLASAGFFNIPSRLSVEDTLTFFTSLEQMATSGVDPQQEKGYELFTKLLSKYDFSPTLTLSEEGNTATAPYIYTKDHQIVPKEYRAWA